LGEKMGRSLSPEHEKKQSGGGIREKNARESEVGREGTRLGIDLRVIRGRG